MSDLPQQTLVYDAEPDCLGVMATACLLAVLVITERKSGNNITMSQAFNTPSVPCRCSALSYPGSTETCAQTHGTETQGFKYSFLWCPYEHRPRDRAQHIQEVGLK